MQHADFLYLAGETKRAVAQLDQAELFLTSALRFEAHSPNTYVSLARVYRAQRAYRKAKELYEHYLQHNERPDAHHELALTLWELGERVDATVHVTRALELEGDRAEYFATRAFFFREQKLFELATADVKRVMRLRPQLMDEYLERAEEKEREGDVVGAE